MKIRKESGEIIEVQYIDGILVSLKSFENNSAPCSHCAFFDKYNLECTISKNRIKECKIEEGTKKGWNTLEYVATPLKENDKIISYEDEDNNS